MRTEAFCHPLSLDCHPVMESQKNTSGSIENKAVTGCHSFSLEKLKKIKEERNNTCNTYVYNNRKNVVTPVTLVTATPERADGCSKPQLPPQESQQLCRGPLSHMRWWNLLLVLWSFAEEYRLAWAAGFCQHIIDVDIDWLRRAMQLTFQKLNAEHQNYLRSEFNIFLEMDQICDWQAMCRGYEYWAVVCTTKFPDVRLMRSVFAWSMAEAKSKFTPCPAEILLGWMRPGDRDYVPVKPEISDNGSLS